MRDFETLRIYDPCVKCRLQRSNAIRRPKNGRKVFENQRQNVYIEIVDQEKEGLLAGETNKKRVNFSFALNKTNTNFVNKWLNQKTKTLSRQAATPEFFTPPWYTRWKYRKIYPAVDNRIQQVDNGFFEKFGSLFREHSEFVAAQEREEKEKVKEEAARVISDETDGSEEDLKRINEDEESASTSDSDIDEPDASELVIGVGLNIDELYSEILYEILHNVGCDVSYEIGQTALFSYVQDAFRMSNDRHQELFSIAEKKEAPEILLNVEVIEAKDLVPKDSNGLSDPFVTLYLASNASHRYNTSVKTGTLNPVWEEHFALPMTENANEDTLCLEVWDFDPAESVKEKFGKLFDVKGVRGIRKLVKEIAVTAATGQHENELVGRARIPLKGIPASGMTMWYSLDKKNKINRQGVVKVRVNFGSEKNSQVAAQEHRHLLRILLLHELEMSKVAPYWWSGTFSAQAEALLTQHIAQSGLNPHEVALAQWVVYTAIHTNHALSFTLFVNTLDKLVKPLQTASTFCEEDIKLFWESCRKLLPSCFGVIRKIRKKTSNEKTAIRQLTDVLKIIRKLSGLDVPENVELFPANYYGWLTEMETNCDINAVLQKSVMQGANEWFDYILENNARHEETDDGKLQFFIKIVQLIRTDLQKAIEIYNKLFQDIANFHYAKTLYVFYQEKIVALAECEVGNICKSLKRLSFAGKAPTDNEKEVSSQPLNVGTTLFELYLIMQRFVLLGSDLCPMEHEAFPIRHFHRWFHGGVSQWLDIAVFKALQRIEKAVELDSLVPVDSTVKYSSSAVDTLTIFYQIKVFWEQLNWPDIEGCYTFIAKIIDDICRCCVFYADKMALRVDGMGDIQDIYEKKFEVTREWCLAINNIDYIRQSLRPFTNELGMEDVLQKLSDLRSPLEAQRCQQTLENVIYNAIDTVKNKIIELLEIVANKMVPAMKRLLTEGAELLHQDSNSVDRLMLYVDNNLSTLHEYLNEDNFNRILEIVWETLGKILHDLLQSNLDKRRPPSFFANLHETLNLMVRSFKPSDQDSECEFLRRTEYLLQLNGLETTELIHEVHLDVWKKQATIEASPYGELSVRVKFQDTDLIIEVINARNLKPMDSNGACDSFVRIHFLPEDKFSGVIKPKTQTHNKTLFPLYDETFVINLTPEQKNLKNGLIMFSVKDKDFLGYNNQYIGEAFVHFKDVPDVPDPISSLPQTHLHLQLPTDLNTDAVKALEHRQGDKLAKEFVRKYKQRLDSTAS